MIHNLPYNIYIGSSGKNGGIYCYRLCNTSELELFDTVPLNNVAYMAIKNNRLFALLRNPFDGTENSGLISFDINEQGRLINPSEIKNTNGLVACHLSVDKDFNVYVANYTSGEVSHIDKEVVKHTGTGPNESRQKSAHPHQIVLTKDGKYVVVVDLGIDSIITYTKSLELLHSIKLRPGVGPRHMVFSSDEQYAYVANELASMVTVLKYNDGEFIELESYSTLPKEYDSENTLSAIRLSIDDKTLMVANRGHNSIAKININGEKLTVVSWIYSGGKETRDFEYFDTINMLVTLNEKSDNICLINDCNDVNSKIECNVAQISPSCIVFKEGN